MLRNTSNITTQSGYIRA